MQTKVSRRRHEGHRTFSISTVLTLKLTSRLLKSSYQFFVMSQLYILENLVRIQLLLYKYANNNVSHRRKGAPHQKRCVPRPFGGGWGEGLEHLCALNRPKLLFILMCLKNILGTQKSSLSNGKRPIAVRVIEVFFFFFFFFFFLVCRYIQYMHLSLTNQGDR